MEQGSSIVSVVVSLPVLLLFLCAAIDFGRMVFLNIALGDGAFAACQAACEMSEGELVPEEAVRTAQNASPALSAPGLAMQASVLYGEPRESPVSQRVFDPSTQSFEARHIEVGSRSVTVRLTLDGTYLTPVGAAVAAAKGDGEGTFSVGASFRATQSLAGGRGGT